jgi:small subunit ribosomal protein S19
MTSLKLPYTSYPLIKKVLQMKEQGKFLQIKTWSRSSTIIPIFIGSTFLVHNGKDFLPVLITENMVGHKLGEFSHTRKVPKHKDSKAA